MSFMSDYEKRMLKNREENKKVLASLGLDKPFFPISNAQRKVPAKQGTKRKRSENENSRKAQRTSADSVQTRELVQSSEEDWRIKYGRRRSGRLMGKEPGDFQGLSFEEEDEEEEEKPKQTPRNRENVFGQIPDIEVGTTWSTRLECSADGVHRPTVAGIHGNASEGCYSLALSGGYEDDVDYGDCFTYTGEGGRDLKGTKSNPKNLRTAPQSKDQTLTRGNLALTKNVEKGRPVRVIRGYKLDSPFAPEEGYRYDGLYTVEKYWQSVGLSGYMVYKFALKRSDNQPPAVWHASKDEDESAVEEDSEDMEQDNTVSPCSTPSEDNKDPAEKSGQNNNTDGGDGKTNDKGAKNNGADVSSTQHDDKNNTAVNASSDESVERTDNESKQDGGGHDAAGDNEDDDHVNTTSGQHDDGNEQTNVKATQGENDDADDNDEHHVTKAVQQEDSNEQTNVKATQGENDDADNNDEHHVTNAIQQEDSNKQTNIKATQGENDDADDEHHVTNAIQQEDNDKTSEAKATQGENDDADNNDEHHVTNAIQQEDNDKTSEAKATQGESDADNNDEHHVTNAIQQEDNDKTSEAKATQDDVNDGDKNPVKNAAQDPNSD